MPGDDRNDFFNNIFLLCGKNNQRAFHSDTFENETQQFESYESKDCCGYADAVHSCSACQADTGCRPDAGCGRQSPDKLFLNNDSAGADETDSAYDLCGYTARVEGNAVFEYDLLKAVLGDDHNQRTTERNQEMGPVACFFRPVFPVQSDDCSEDTGNK